MADILGELSLETGLSRAALSRMCSHEMYKLKSRNVSYENVLPILRKKVISSLDSARKSLSLERTAAAIDEYDRFVGSDLRRYMTYREVEEAAERFEQLERAVGVAYGEDTKGINNPETCAQAIRPGLKNPAPGHEISFVRYMVELWKAANKAQ